LALNLTTEYPLEAKPVRDTSDLLNHPGKNTRRLSVITNLTKQLYHRQTTSRTSLRSFYIKTLVLQNFFEKNIPCCPQWVMDHFDEEVGFVQRNINRSIKANRYLQSDQMLYPSNALIKHIKAIYRDSGLPFIETDDRFAIKISPFKALQFLIDYCRISLTNKKKPETLLQQVIQLTLWEPLFYERKNILTTGQIARRIETSKSTLSTALSVMLDQGLLKTKQDCSDSRITYWQVNPAAPSLREKYLTLRDYLDGNEYRHK